MSDKPPTPKRWAISSQMKQMESDGIQPVPPVSLSAVRLLNKILRLQGHYRVLLKMLTPRSGIYSIKTDGFHVFYPAKWMSSDLLLSGVNKTVPDFTLVRDLIPKFDGAFVDVGANTGHWSLLVWKNYACRVFAYEPDPILFEVLKLNVKQNNLHEVTCFNYGLSNTETSLKFNTGPNGSFENREIVSPSNTTYEIDWNDCVVTSEHEIAIRVTSLDNDLSAQKIGLIKIDCEGFEVQVIEGSLGIIKSQMPHLFVEIHPSILKGNGISSDWIFRLLDEIYNIKFFLPPYEPKTKVGRFTDRYITRSHKEISREQYARIYATEDEVTQMYAYCEPRRSSSK
ncbi:MAG TPA: FkbM family methyltransferase [Pyrinomonadaceae bacterium]|nr:FkbM family methyltransferase [Pyrinomonadaceae bacterium]